jgi:hypothetical protein
MQAHLSISVRADAIKSEVNPGSEDPFAVLELGSSNAAFNFMTLAEIDALIKAAAIMKRRFEATLSGQRHEYAPEEHLGHCDTCGQLRRSPLHQVPEDDFEPLPPGAVLQDLLLVAGARVPLSAVRNWTAAEYRAAQEWAAAEHLSASDNPVKRLPKPQHVTDAEAGHTRAASSGTVDQAARVSAPDDDTDDGGDDPTDYSGDGPDPYYVTLGPRCGGWSRNDDNGIARACTAQPGHGGEVHIKHDRDGSVLRTWPREPISAETVIRTLNGSGR